MSIAAIRNLSAYNWSDWFIGLMRSFLSGGAAALITQGGGAVLGIPGKQLWELTGINFVIMGLYRLGEFLQLHGAPDKLQQSLDIAAKESAKVVAQAGKAADAVADAKAQADTTKP